MGAMIIYGFLLAAVICGGGLAIIMWLNSKDSSIDNLSYDKSFNPNEKVSRYRVTQPSEDDFVNPEKVLRHYAHNRNRNSTVVPIEKDEDEDFSLDGEERLEDEAPDLEQFYSRDDSEEEETKS